MQTNLLKPKAINVEQLGMNRAKVALEPFERGYGHTLGNALRRVLLSSMPGYAATEVTIAGVLHEYSSSDTNPGRLTRAESPSRSVLAASRNYLRRNGTPASPEDLVAHNCLHYPRAHDLLALIPLADMKRRRIDHGQKLCPRLPGQQRRLLVPRVLANQQADPHPSTAVSGLEHAGSGTGRKIAPFIE